MTNICQVFRKKDESNLVLFILFMNRTEKNVMDVLATLFEKVEVRSSVWWLSRVRDVEGSVRTSTF